MTFEDFLQSINAGRQGHSQRVQLPGDASNLAIDAAKLHLAFRVADSLRNNLLSFEEFCVFDLLLRR